MFVGEEELRFVMANTKFCPANKEKILGCHKNIAVYLKRYTIITYKHVDLRVLSESDTCKEYNDFVYLQKNDFYKYLNEEEFELLKYDKEN